MTTNPTPEGSMRLAAFLNEVQDADDVTAPVNPFEGRALWFDQDFCSVWEDDTEDGIRLARARIITLDSGADVWVGVPN